MNQLRLDAQVTEISPVRYTPAGVPVLEMVLEHTGTVEEAGVDRQVMFSLPAVALGDLARLLSDTLPGTGLKAEGFLAPRRRGANRLVLHLQRADRFGGTDPLVA